RRPGDAVEDEERADLQLVVRRPQRRPGRLADKARVVPRARRLRARRLPPADLEELRLRQPPALPGPPGRGAGEGGLALGGEARRPVADARHGEPEAEGHARSPGFSY